VSSGGATSPDLPLDLYLTTIARLDDGTVVRKLDQRVVRRERVDAKELTRRTLQGRRTVLPIRSARRPAFTRIDIWLLIERGDYGAR